MLDYPGVLETLLINFKSCSPPEGVAVMMKTRQVQIFQV